MYAGISTVPSPFYQALKIFERTVQIQLLQSLDGADSGNEEKSKRAEKYGTEKSKERREEPWRKCLTRPVPNGRRRSGF